MASSKPATQAQQYAESIIDTVREPLIVLDHDLRVVSASRSFYQVFKVKPKETVGQLIYDLGDKQWDIPKLRELLETILPKKATFDDYEVEHNFLGIGRRTMLLNARRIPRPPEKPKVILLAIEDVTQRRKTEKSALELAAIVNTSIDGIIGKSLQGNVISWNEGAERIYGYTEKEMQGHNISLLAPPGYKEEILQQLKQLRNGELIKNHETKRIRKDGVIIDISLTLSPIKDKTGKICGVSAIMHDITEQKKARQVRLVSEYSENIINTVREPLIVLDQDLRVVSVSQSFYEFFKVKPAETVGQLIYDLGNKQWDIPKLRELLETILPKKAAFNNYEVEHNFATIGRRTMLLNARQIQRASGKERIILLAIEDITERKKGDVELHRLNRTLKAQSQSDQAMMQAGVESDYMDDVCGIIVKECGHAMVWIGFAEHDEKKSIRVMASAGFAKTYLDTLNISWADTERGRGPAGSAIRTGKPGICRNMLTDPAFKPWRAAATKHGFASSIAFPLTMDGTVFGVLSIYSREPDPFTDDEILLLTELANDLSHGISAIRLRAGLEKTHNELEATKVSEHESREYSESIIDTVREPLIALDQNLRVVTASRSFYEVFKVNPKETVGHLIYDLGNKQWDIPKLRELLETILPQKASFNNYEVEHNFATIGRRVMLLNARQIQRASGMERIILLAIEDITERKEIEAGLEKTRKELAVIKKTADEASEFAESLINTVREPLLSLDQDLRVVAVSRSFYDFFQVKPEETVGHLIYDLGNKQWDIPKLRELLETILPQKASFNNYEVEHNFATIGRRTMLLNARQIQRVSGKERIILLAIEDITERKEIEAGLEKTRKELAVIKKTADETSEFAESIIDTVREPLLSLDQDLRVVTASRSFYEVFKVNPKETVGHLIYDLGNKQWDIPKLRELLETILPQKASFNNYEVEHNFATIGRRVMLLNARQIQRASGKERIILLAIEDITERKEIEAGLEKTRKELAVIKKTADETSEFAESIIDTVREPLLSLDQDLRVVTASRSFYEVFKVNPKETVGHLIYDLGNKQWDIPKLRELLETILPQKASFNNYEVEHNFATIGRRVMLLNARQIQRASGKERIILLAIEDITERKEIEAGLEKTRKELAVIKKTADEVSEFAESIINTVREPLLSLDQDLRVVAVSQSFYEFFKVKPAETVGQLIYDLGNKQWDIPKLRELLETILPQKASFNNYEVEHNFATIGRRVMLLNARQIQRASGKERIILLAIEDITERKEIEAGLVKAHQELSDLAIELKRVARAKSEFLANMSHELRTPLNSINGFSEVLYDETFGPLNEKQKKYVTNVLTSGKHLLLLINQILDMAKVESGKMKLSLSTISPKNLLDEISLLVADMVNSRKLELQMEIAGDLPEIEADELKVKEIIYNLLSNAVKFTPEGGKIGIRANKTGPEIEIVVWDTGIGIAPENMEKLFEGFFRVDTPYSRVTEGTGLGLPISKKLVELHGGKLTVESAGLDQGTAIRLTLPIISKEGGV